MRCVGYFVERRTEQQVWLQDLQANLYTHLVYGFVSIDEEGRARMPSPTDQHKNAGRLKNVNPNLKVLLGVDACSENFGRFLNVVACEQLRRMFAASVLHVLEVCGFDGVDLFCDFPLCRTKQDKEDMSALLAQLKAKLKDKYVLSASLGAELVFLSPAFDVPKIFEHVDFVNLLTVNMHSHSEMRTGSSAPLNSTNRINVETCLRGWIQAGAEPQKINMAVTPIAKTFTLTSPYINCLGSPANGPGFPGAYTNKPGEIDYYELLLTQKQPNWIVMWSEAQKIPYMYNLSQWISYENYASVERKIKLAASLGINGVAVWTVEADDMYGKTGMKYPFVKMIREIGEKCGKI